MQNSANNRSPKGAMGFVEISAAALFMVVLALLGLDICLAIFGASINDRACRDAARAAAGGNDATKAWSLAYAALQAYKTDGFFITSPVAAAAGTSMPSGYPGSGYQYFVYQDFGGSVPVGSTPYVTVTTQTNVRVPAPIFFFGANFVNGNYLNFAQQYTFPIVKTKLIQFAS